MSTGIRYSKNDLISYHDSSGKLAPLVVEYGDLLESLTAAEKLNLLVFLGQWQEWDTLLQQEGRAGCRLSQYLDRDDPLKESPATETVYICLQLLAEIDDAACLDLIIAIANQLRAGIFRQ
jgi:hypothetical protein